ncbi:hypothetical protein [Geobacillus sp. JS12]|uniref:hypothetical protein n=1 Tax=Geobacillus sp. JS12 TaxID=1813182 RepID=UPI000FFBCD56|nr:hypothetical protein [Geobacillus sp. JS12]
MSYMPAKRTLAGSAAARENDVFIIFSQTSPFVHTSSIVFVRKVTVAPVLYSYDSVKAGKLAVWRTCRIAVMGMNPTKRRDTAWQN